MTDPLNIIFEDCGIWLLGYRIEFICIYIQKAIISLVLCGYEVQTNMSFLDFEPPLRMNETRCGIIIARVTAEHCERPVNV